MPPFKSEQGELPPPEGIDHPAYLPQAWRSRQPERTPRQPLEFPSTLGAIVGCLDMTGRKVAETHLKELVYQDSLTGLADPVLFHDHLCLVLSQARRLGHMAAMIMLDADPWKTINGSQGRLRGDLVFKSIYQRLTSKLRKTDTVARLSGNEFGIILTRISRAGDADKIAQRILNLFQQPFIFEDHEVWITASIGMALYPKDSENPQALIQKADMARYGGMVAGRNNCQHYAAGLNPWRRKNPSMQGLLGL